MGNCASNDHSINSLRELGWQKRRTRGPHRKVTVSPGSLVMAMTTPTAAV
jgi:predicted RNA binding protein YcfA (HicA-like mRNA interferase family)